MRRYFRTEKMRNGKPVYLEITRKCEPQTQWRAEQLANEIQREAERVIQRPSSNQTVDQFLNSFLATIKVSVERRTYDYYAGLYRRFVKDTHLAGMLLEDVRLRDFSKPMDVQRFYESLKASPTGIRKIHTFLSIAFNKAVAWDVIAKNPCKGAVLPKKRDAEPEYYDQAQARQFIAACRESDKNIVFETALETGMRPGEYLALPVSNVRGRSIKIERAVTWFETGGFEIKDPKTKKSRRTIDITDDLAKRLKLQIENVLEWRKGLKGAEARAAKKYDLVFPSTSGGPISRNNLNRREFREVLKFAGLPLYSLYALRHTSATLLLAGGVDVLTVSERLGHADIRTTLNTYAHVLESMKSRAVEVIGTELY